MKIDKAKLPIYSIVIITAILISIAALINEQQIFKILPLYVSLFVMLLQSEGRRIGLLVGGLNSLLYAVVDYSYGLYASALSDILLSFTIQTVAFILWTKRKDGKTTVFRSMRPLHRLLLTLGIIAVYVPCLIVNTNIGAAMAPFDTWVFVNSIITPLIMMFAFIEYTYVGVINCIVVIIMNALMLKETPDRFSYLIYSIYSAICSIRALINVAKIYKRQWSGAQIAESAEI